MDLTDLTTLKFLLSRFHLRPSLKLGQNFLVSRQVLTDIISAAELSSDDAVLEIGAGIGTLTLELASRAGRVFAIEKDRRLIKPLRFVLKEISNVEILNDDFLKLDISQLFTPRYSFPTSFKVVANIPYYITGQILQRLLSLPSKPASIVLLVQKEVGERVCAGPGQMSILSVSVQFFGEPQIIGRVLKEDFYPAPEVDSVILRITPFEKPALEVEEKKVFRLVRMGFASKRKTLENNLAGGLRISKSQAAKLIALCGLGPKIRAQELAVEDWKRLYSAINEKPGL